VAIYSIVTVTDIGSAVEKKI